jgi:hypothetical protein
VTEKDFESSFRQAFELLGWLGYHTHNSRRSTAGFPDWVLVRQPRIVFAELKTDTGKVSDDQQAWLDELAHVETQARGLLRQLGLTAARPVVEVHVWRPRDWPTLCEVLR